jgi:molybdopterin synthase catalytic subunit
MTADDASASGRPGSAGAGPAIRIRVRLFARQRELAGAREVPVELPAGATIEDGWRAVAARYPAIESGRPWLRFARNGEYADAETPLADGDELACIPPVSSGADGAGEGPAARILEVRDAPFGNDLLGHLAGRLAIPADGAVVGFLGLTRESPGTPAPGQEAEAALHAGRRVTSLDYEAHESMVLRILGLIADEIEARFGVRRLAIVHRTGEVPLGEPSIAIVTCSPHRAAAFEAARYAIEETKARAPIWKAERFADGHVWIGRPAREGPRQGDGEPGSR